MVFTIHSLGTGANGLDLVPFIGEGGVKWTANGIDSSDAGRATDATMYRGFVGYKAKCEVSCLWMSKAEAYRVMQAIMPEYITVTTDTIPWRNGTVTMTMYSNNVSSTLATEYTDGHRLYTDMEIPLVER